MQNERPKAASKPQDSVIDIVRAFLAPLASLRLTVVLFALSIILVFFGTLALIDNGMWTVIHSYFKSFVVWIKLDLLRQFLQVFFFWSKESQPWTASVPFPGGVSIAIALLFNMLAAHAVRFKFAWRRLGIIILHAGLILLLGGELITRIFAVEATMTLQEGESCNYVDVADSSELVFIDASDPELEKVTAISHTALASAAANKKTISHESLPFDVKCEEFFKNSNIRGLRPGAQPNAKAGLLTDKTGVSWEVTPTSESSGVDTEMRENASAARITLCKKGTDQIVNKLFVSCWFDRNFTRRQIEFPTQTVTGNDSTYQVELRQKRIYKPYTIALKKFEHDVFQGTTKAKDFASTVRLIHPERNENRETRIWMNNPLRYDASKTAGFFGILKSMNPIWNDSETFFQAGFIPDDSGTILQVVQNPSWIWPYVSCTMITAGMLLHFLMVLVKFINKQINATSPAVVSQNVEVKASPRRGLPIFIACIIAATFGGYLASKARHQKSVEGTLDLISFGQIPVQEGGRIQPLDSFARNTMQALSNSEEYDVPRTDDEMAHISSIEKIVNTIRSQDGTTKRKPAIEWLLSVLGTRDLFNNPGAKYKVFKIESIEVLDFLGLERRPGFYRYSPEEMKDSFDKFKAEYEKVKDLDAKKRTLFQTKIHELGVKLGLYQQIVMLRTPVLLPPTVKDDNWTNIGRWDEAAAEPRVRDELQQMFIALKNEIEKNGRTLEQIPPELRREIAKSFEEKSIKRTNEISDQLRPSGLPNGQAVYDILNAGRANDAVKFNDLVKAFREQNRSQISDKSLSRIKTEHWLNAFDPFYYCSVLFIVAFILGLCTWFGWVLPRFRLTTWLSTVMILAITIVVQITAMLSRMYLMDRPLVFVTNLYSSAVFIGTCVAVVCVVLEIYSRLGVGSMVAAVLGFGTTYIARHLQSTGDTLEMMQAVLDTNLWLATHVTTVTFGYAATLIAGGIAILYCGLGICTPILKGSANKAVAGMLYGTICFATLLSFVGTVLGGIWADQSWGRFWGWDPKENGALLIVAWNALILHARWAGLVKARGMAVLAIAGISITMWSWFGTNQLGIGLHAYGFNNTLAMWCTATWVITPLLMIPFASIPTQAWWSNRVK